VIWGSGRQHTVYHDGVERQSGYRRERGRGGGEEEKGTWHSESRCDESEEQLSCPLD
jgi:hypothetical protein